MTNKDICGSCKGYGLILNEKVNKCDICDGKGYLICQYPNCPCTKISDITCHKCRRTGYIKEREYMPCNKCDKND